MGQTGEHRGGYYLPVTGTVANPHPTGYLNYPPRAPPVHTTPNSTEGEPSARWDSVCSIEHAERNEIHLKIILRRYPPA